MIVKFFDWQGASGMRRAVLVTIFMIMQCIDLDLDLLIIFLSSEISLFLCFDLDLGFPLVLFWLNRPFVYVYIYICKYVFVNLC